MTSLRLARLKAKMYGFGPPELDWGAGGGRETAKDVVIRNGAV